MAEEFSKRKPFVVEWRAGFAVSIPQVDAEHQHLFTLVKALEVGSVQTTIDELLDYVVTHFTNEQQLMEDSGYPEFSSHIKLHEEFAVSVADFLGGSSDWSEDRVQELRRFLNKWLIGHIMTHDMRFGIWHRKHSNTPAPTVQRVAVAQERKGFFGRLFRMAS